MAQNKRAESKAQYTSDENGQRVVYQSASQNYHVLRYQVLAGVLGLLSLYLFLRGDATYLTILAVPTAAYCAFLLMKQNQARRAIPVVRQILQNSDRTYQVSIETNRVISRLQNVNSIRYTPEIAIL